MSTTDPVRAASAYTMIRTALSIFTILSLFLIGKTADAQPVASQTAYLESDAYKRYRIATEIDDNTTALTILTDITANNPGHSSLELELAILLLRMASADSSNTCKAVTHLEMAVSLGELFLSRRLLDGLYAGNWSLAATLEGSAIAREQLELDRQTHEFGLLSALGLTDYAFPPLSLDTAQKVVLLCNRS